MPERQPILTEAEAVAALSASGVNATGIPEFDTWIAYMLQQAQAAADVLEDAFYEQLRASVSAPADPVALRTAEEAWRNEARRQANTLARQMTEDQLKSIGETVARGIEAGKGPKEIARSLDAVTGLDAQRAARLDKARDYYVSLGLSPEEADKKVERLRQQLLRDRKEVIAQTEARHATEEAQRQQASGRGARFKVWLTTGDDRVSDECAENEAAGVIPINEEFPGGVQRPPQHPRCRCSVTYITNDEQLETSEAKVEARVEATAQAREGKP